MGGFANDSLGNSIVWADNIDFSQNVIPSRSITANGQLLIGSTAAPNIRTGTLTSPGGTITIGYSSPNITIDLVGGSAAIEKIAVQTGTTPIVPLAGVVTFNGATVAAGTNPVRTDGTGANTMALEVQLSQAIAGTDATKVGLAAFNSANFTVDANGFVSSLSTAFAWSDQSGAFAAAAANGYFITAVSTATLPALPSEGDTIRFIVDTASLLTIQANTGQKIRIGTTIGAAAGTAVNTQQGDAIELTYRSTGTTWFAANNPVGGWNVT